jgi:hypothetical protein
MRGRERDDSTAACAGRHLWKGGQGNGPAAEHFPIAEHFHKNFACRFGPKLGLHSDVDVLQIIGQKRSKHFIGLGIEPDDVVRRFDRLVAVEVLENLA